MRRLRDKKLIRDWVSETQLHPKNIILPYFVVKGKGIKEPIKSMPGVYHFSIDELLKDIQDARGIKSVLLFGVSEKKDGTGREGYKKNGIVQQAVKELKKKFKDLVVITDVCLCAYTSHGHCGIVKESSIDNDESLKVLVKIALSHAASGADFVAPSAMMDGQVRAIRQALDKNGFKGVGILAYSAKYASNFYGPFREATECSPKFGDRKTYQMDLRNSDEALREIKQDIDEGADLVMVKPALAYLDIIYRAKKDFSVPIVAYNVSGEYSLIKKLASKDKVKERELALEVLTSIKRAGADLIISYFGKEVGKWLK
ncbi:MAG: porphobilinogen synthase [Candidatus Omnitrophota bacterium]|jgi:porphobilinogen synthase|nr:porphobilinogen synthase [Candidatus Omnitrophota bacterium]